MAEGASPSLLSLRDLHKSYAAPVLRGVALDLRPGEVHALLGANGAGKSTLARIVAGLALPDAGRMALDGAPYAPRTKAEAERSGVQIVQQEGNLIGTLTVAENLFFGRLPSRRGFIDREELDERANEVLALVGLEDLDPRTSAHRLSVSLQQLVEIAAAIARRARVLVLDEPTAALAEPQVETLFDNVRRLARGGVGVLYISHRLEETRRIADRATVLRDGAVQIEAPFSELTEERIVEAMTGRERTLASTPRARELGPTALRVESLGLAKRFEAVSFTVREGEIFGLSGLMGSGRSSLLRSIFGAERADSGGIALNDAGPLVRFREPREATRAGLAMVPEDRKRDGLLLPRSIRLNAALAVLGKLGPWLAQGIEARAAEPVCDRLAIDRAGPHQPVLELSGGNQQKVVVARWLLAEASVLLFDEPTRGIDVAARATLYRLLDDLASEGKAVVVASSDLDELLSICDRIGVLSAGRLVEVRARSAWTREDLTRASFRGFLETSA